MGSLSLDVGQGNCNKLSFPKRVSSSLPKLNSDTCFSMLGGEFVRRRDMGIGHSYSSFEKSSVKPGWLMVEINWRVEVLALFVVDRSKLGSFAAVALVVSDRMLMQTVLSSRCRQ